MYIDVFHSTKDDSLYVLECVNNVNKTLKYPSELFFYYNSNSGSYKSSTGENCEKFSTHSYKDFKSTIEDFRRQGRKLYESDVKPSFKFLESHYKNCELPSLNICCLDIETDFDKENGFSSPEEAANKITAITIKLKWIDKLISLVIRPNTLTDQQAKEITDSFENTFLCSSEKELLTLFLDFIQDANILTGWNSSGYDIPYIVNRITKILGKKATSRMCLWNQLPKERKYKKYGEESITYDLIGRQHLDYLDLYRKYTYHELQSYRLDYVGQIELNERKVQYDGSLDALYNNDFKKFIEYNRQDTDLLSKLDDKLQYIDLVNFIAHENLVTIQTVLGSVALSDNALLLETHNKGMVSPAKDRDDFRQNSDDFDDSDETDEDKIAGAYVKDPIPGMYENIGSVDINSLYPSTFRALNMSPETIVGHIEQKLTAKLFEDKIREFRKTSKKEISNAWLWSGVFEIPEVLEVINKTDTELKFIYNDGQAIDTTAKKLWDMILKHNWMISANGVVFRSDKEGIVPSVLTRWFKERKQYQKTLKLWTELDSGIEISEDLAKLL